MAGRFRLYTDADIRGPFVHALKHKGWDLLRAVDLYPEGTADAVHFERAAREGRVLVSNDIDQVRIAQEWILAGRSFAGLVIWPKADDLRMTPADLTEAFDVLASEDTPFSPYPIVYLKPKRGRRE